MELVFTPRIELTSIMIPPTAGLQEVLVLLPGLFDYKQVMVQIEVGSTLTILVNKDF